MGAIQSAINQGVTTAAVLGQLSGVPELRKASRLQKSIIEGAHRITDKGEAAFSQKEFENVKPAVEAYINTNKQLFEKTGNPKYMKEYMETSQEAAQFANNRAKQLKANKEIQRQAYINTSIGELPVDIVKQAKEIKK